MADVHQNLRIVVFEMTLSRKARIHRGSAKLLPLIKTSMKKTLDLQVNSGKLMKIAIDSLLIVTLFLDLQRKTLKSVLTPTQRKIFLGFDIDSVNMTISLPDKKRLAIIQKANSLFGQNLISVRNLCQFVGMHSATRPALRQASLFHRKIQLSINKILSKTGLNRKLCYNQIIPSDFQVRQNLEWWAVEMPHHCTAPVIPPPVDVKIATDSCCPISYYYATETVRFHQCGKILFVGLHQPHYHLRS